MLTDKINQFSALKPDYNEQLSNHLPMTAHALMALGATNTHISQYIKEYTSRLEQAENHPLVINRDSWQEHLGQNIYYKNYFEYFLGEFEHASSSEVLKLYLPVFIKSPASRAFHCMLRLAYGIMSNNKV
ncbi:MAG: DUF4243 domain-containing protein [Rhizobiales bacterium]|nr:DUF4243 domain-containing protein [Hyphomicrobiales bacterium]